ncbi:MAG: hypothetical protein ACR2LK_11780 [Solirubrobacteraceae bacterium]
MSGTVAVIAPGGHDARHRHRAHRRPPHRLSLTALDAALAGIRQAVFLAGVRAMEGSLRGARQR